jgi:predicted ATPase
MDIQKQLKTTVFIITNNFCYNNIVKKSSFFHPANIFCQKATIRLLRNLALSPLYLINFVMGVHKVVLTGGPCGGKTTGQKLIVNVMEEKGFYVYQVPETATVLFTGGIKIPQMTVEQRLETQIQIIRVQLQLEDAFFAQAASFDRDCLVIMDRGIMDSLAYVVEDDWDQVLEEVGLTLEQIRQRYDQVIHVMSAAKGAAEHYNQTTNTERLETIEEASLRDTKTLEAWSSICKPEVVDNEHQNFGDKMTKLIKLVEAGVLRSTSGTHKVVPKPPLKQEATVSKPRGISQAGKLVTKKLQLAARAIEKTPDYPQPIIQEKDLGKAAALDVGIDITPAQYKSYMEDRKQKKRAAKSKKKHSHSSQ